VDLRPGSAAQRLRAHDLRPADPGGARISGVGIETDAALNRVRVRIDVPEDRPPGTYSAVVVDEDSNVPRGTIALRILP
jgi:hypothetical protein